MVMTHAALFLSAFFTVFLLGAQQQNVHGRHYLAAIVTSLGIGSAQIFLWRLVPEANAGEIAATLAGGPVGIVCAMWAHPRIAAAWRRRSGDRSSVIGDQQIRKPKTDYRLPITGRGGGQ
jgi:hypothetical protein